MKTNKGLNVIMGKKLAKIRGYTEMPKGHTLQSLLDLGGEASKEELIQIGKEITKHYTNKIEELEAKLKPVKQKDFKDYILEEVDERFYDEMNNNTDKNTVGCEINIDLVKVKAQCFWEKANWYDYQITIGDEKITGNRLL